VSTLLSLSLCFSLFAGEILLATIAQVKNHVITTREIQMHYILDKLLGNKPYLDQQKDPVESLISEWLLVFEARDFYDKPMSNDVVLGKVKALMPKLKAVKGWDQLVVSETELRGMVLRKLEARRLFEFKRKASRLPVSDSEVEVDYKQNRIRYGTTEFAKVKEDIRSRKAEENMKLRLGNWFTVLAKKYRVQRFAEYNQK